MVRLTSLFIAAAIAVSACGSDGDTSSSPANEVAPTETVAAAAFATIGAEEAAVLIDDGPDDLVVLDVRTPEEFAEGHLEGAVLVDFYAEDFTEQLAALDPDVPYVVYCRSGNRSGQTVPVMEELGFSSATDIAGGILAWEDADLPVVVE
jgi:rhodanese-related sulfurtransferase